MYPARNHKPQTNNSIRKIGLSFHFYSNVILASLIFFFFNCLKLRTFIEICLFSEEFARNMKSKFQPNAMCDIKAKTMRSCSTKTKWSSRFDMCVAVAWKYAYLSEKCDSGTKSKLQHNQKCDSKTKTNWSSRLDMCAQKCTYFLAKAPCMNSLEFTHGGFDSESPCEIAM